MEPRGANDAGVLMTQSWRISSGFCLDCSVFHHAFSMCINPDVGVGSKMQGRSNRVVGKTRLSKQRCNGSLWSVFNQDNRAEIFLWAYFFCLELDPTCTGHGVCRVAQLVLKSAAARQQGGAHQRRLVINHHSCSGLVPALLPYQAEGRRRGENDSGRQIPLTNNHIYRLV